MYVMLPNLQRASHSGDSVFPNITYNLKTMFVTLKMPECYSRLLVTTAAFGTPDAGSRNGSCVASVTGIAIRRH